MASTFPSPFLAAVAQPRQKGFAESILDDLTNISTKQALALPLTIPAHAAAGAIEGLTFGLLSPTDELEEFLGEYAPPAPIQTASEIAGTIGGTAGWTARHRRRTLRSTDRCPAGLAPASTDPGAHRRDRPEDTGTGR